MAAATPAAAPRPPPDPRGPRTQLQFTWNAPAVPADPPARYVAPRPIVIEKLKPPPEGGLPRDPRAGDGPDLAPSPVEFAVVSQERLLRAVQLAKRDVRRRHHLGAPLRQRLPDPGGVEGPAPCPRGRDLLGAPSTRAPGPRPKQEGPPGHPRKAGATTTSDGSRAKVYLRLPAVGQGPPPPMAPDSPPTHDPGLAPVPSSALQEEADRGSLEVRRLQGELRSYVQKVEELARRERSQEEALDPQEERRACVRRQEQAARSARTLYVLQQQVKEIEEELERLSPHRVKHTKKSRARARLAAAHRGAVRALQAFVAPFAGRPRLPPPPALPPPSATQFRQLGRLLRQLSLCSARLEMGSSVPDVVVDLLLQIEDLDSLLARQASPQQRPAGLSLPPGGPAKGPARGPQKEKAAGASQAKRPAAARKLLPDKPPEPEEIARPEEAGGSRGRQGGLPPSPAEAPGQRDARDAAVGPGRDPSRPKGGPLPPSKPQGSGRPPRAKGGPQPLAKQARFQEPTVSFRLKEAKPPVRESRTPWLPPSLASPLSSPPRRPERSPPAKELPLGRGAAAGGKRGPLDKEEARAAGGSPSPSPTGRKAERSFRESLEPLLAQAQKANLQLDGCTDQTEALPAGRPQPPVHTGQPAEVKAGLLVADPLLAPGLPDLEEMLHRMEEMERFQEGVRRRYHRVVYSDTDFSAREEAKERGWGAAMATPPPPVQATRLGSPREMQAAILLGKPLDADAAEEEEEEEEGASAEPLGRGGERPPAQQQPPARRGGGAFLSVPPSVLQSVRDYGSRFEQHLRGLGHEPVGGFDPWQLARSLAEELVEEAVAEVAGELQGLCEDYAEAVFTSEFLRAPE